MKQVIRYIYDMEQKDRTMFFMFLSLIANGVFSVYKILTGITTSSDWLTVNGLFYCIATLTRLFSIRDYRRYRLESEPSIKVKIKQTNYFNNGVMLLVLSFAYLFISLYLINQPSIHEINQYIIIGIAAISFWNLGTAIYGLIKYKNTISSIVKATRVVNCSVALTSIVATQVALLAYLEPLVNNSFQNGFVGITVSIFIFIMGLYLILTTKHQTGGE